MKARLVFIDESGFQMAPFLRRTWAPKGRTPILRHSGKLHAKVSAIAALCITPHRGRAQLYFRLHPQRSIDASLICQFLHQLRHQIRQAIIIVWDRLRAHKAQKVSSVAQGGTKPILIEYLPPYAPSLNPVEYLWSHLKTNPLANVCEPNVDQLADKVRRSTSQVRSDSMLLKGFVAHSGLPL